METSDFSLQRELEASIITFKMLRIVVFSYLMAMSAHAAGSEGEIRRILCFSVHLQCWVDCNPHFHADTQTEFGVQRDSRVSSFHRTSDGLLVMGFEDGHVQLGRSAALLGSILLDLAADRITSIASNRNFVAVGSKDGKGSVISRDDGEIVSNITEHDQWIHQVLMNDDFLITLSKDGKVSAGK